MKNLLTWWFLDAPPPPGWWVPFPPSLPHGRGRYFCETPPGLLRESIAKAATSWFVFSPRIPRSTAVSKWDPGEDVTHNFWNFWRSRGFLSIGSFFPMKPASLPAEYPDGYLEDRENAENYMCVCMRVVKNQTTQWFQELGKLCILRWPKRTSWPLDIPWCILYIFVAVKLVVLVQQFGSCRTCVLLVTVLAASLLLDFGLAHETRYTQMSSTSARWLWRGSATLAANVMLETWNHLCISLPGKWS